MKHVIKSAILKLILGDVHASVVAAERDANVIAEYICSPEFTALYAQECLSNPGLGLREMFNQWRTIMSALTDAMTALGQQIAAGNSAANAAHFSTIDAHLTKLDTEEGADEATIADTSAGLQALITAAKGTSSASGTSSAGGTSTAGTVAATTAAAKA